MTIIFYTQSNEPNSFPKALGNGDSFNGYLRNECDILNPVIDIVSGTSTLSYNYAYIPEFKRYYFITGIDIIPSRKDVGSSALFNYSISMHVDVLQSWSGYIIGHEAFIERAENEFFANFKIQDSNILSYPTHKNNLLNLFEPISYVFGDDINTYITRESTNIFDSYETNFVVTTLSKGVDNLPSQLTKPPYNLAFDGINSDHNYNQNMYVLNYDQLEELARYYMTPNILEEIFILKSKSFSYITGISSVPFELDRVITNYIDAPLEVGNSISLGTIAKKILSLEDSNKPIQGFRLIMSKIRSIMSDDTNELILPAYKDFRYYSPLCEWELHIPFFGYIELNPLILSNADYLDVRFFLEPASGILTVKVVEIVDNKEIVCYNQSINIYANMIAGLGMGEFFRDMAVSLAGSFLNAGISMLGSGSNSITTTSPVEKVTNYSELIKSRNNKTGRMVNKSSVNATSTERTDSVITERKYTSGNKISNMYVVNGITNALNQNTNRNFYQRAHSLTAYANSRHCFFKYKKYESEYPYMYENTIGYIYNKGMKLSDLKGFVKVGECHLNIPCTITETTEIDDLLKSGVLIN